MYPLEVQLARNSRPAAASGRNGKSSGISAINHAAGAPSPRSGARPVATRNSAAAADAIRELSDEQLDRAAPVSLNAEAPLTCQFMLEDHAVRHSFHHLAILRATLQRRMSAALVS
jgi:hypothetical protein